MFAMAELCRQLQAATEILSLRGHEAGAEKYSDALSPAMKFVTEWFGKPSAPVTIADLSDPHAAPFESGTLLMVSMAGEDTKLAGINVVHEFVHSALASPRPWVYEGLAHFAEAMYCEQQGWKPTALDLLGIHRGWRFWMPKKMWPLAGTRKFPLRRRGISDSRSPQLMTRFITAARRLMSGGCCVTWWATMR